jgi:hypothetical protein
MNQQPTISPPLTKMTRHLTLTRKEFQTWTNRQESIIVPQSPSFLFSIVNEEGPDVSLSSLVAIHPFNPITI